MKLRHALSLFLAVVMLTSMLSACVSEITTAITTDEDTTTTEPSTTTKAPTTSDSGDVNPPAVDTADWLSGYLDEMPTFTINTENGAAITSKEEYINATISVASTEASYNMTDEIIEIRGRGNYTWSSTEKKSYRIKFAEKTNLLGQGGGPARSWTLLAVHCDQSLLRTAAALTLASKMPGIQFSSSVRFARLVLNGEYMGVYQVSEQMQVQKYRVNVDDTVQEGSEIGFLVELDKRASEVVVSDGWGLTYELKSDYYSAEQLYYISNCLFDAFESVTTGDREYISEMIDLESVVDAYIVEELFKNLDVGWGSFYMYKDVGDDKLHFGPLWDFDLSAGNADPDDGDSNFSKPQGIYVGDTDCWYSQAHRWFQVLCQYDWFNEMVKERWFALADIVNEVPSYVRRVAALYSDEFDENFERWPIFGRQINREPAAVRALKTHDAHAEYVAKWLEQRISWLNDYYNGKVVGDSSGGTVEDYTFSGGKGTKNDPFLISTAKDFSDLTTAMLFGEKFSNKHFKQTADLDMTGYIGYNGIGKSGTFAGVYNGNGYSITAEIKGGDECIFPYVSGTVMNLVTYGSIDNTDQAAGIARSVRRNGVIVNCASYMDVNSPKQSVGITASNQDSGGTISGCFFGGTINPEGVRSGAINYFVDGYAGEFSYNYCLDTTVGRSKGNETVITASELSSTVGEMNRNLSKLSGGVDSSLLCSWKLEDGKLVLISK